MAHLIRDSEMSELVHAVCDVHPREGLPDTITEAVGKAQRLGVGLGGFHVSALVLKRITQHAPSCRLQGPVALGFGCGQSGFGHCRCLCAVSTDSQVLLNTGAQHQSMGRMRRFIEVLVGPHGRSDQGNEQPVAGLHGLDQMLWSLSSQHMGVMAQQIVHAPALTVRGRVDQECGSQVVQLIPDLG